MDQDDDLPPIAMIVELIEDALKQLEGVEELLVAHRRAAGVDQHTIARLQLASGRIGMAWTATITARNGLRNP